MTPESIHNPLAYASSPHITIILTIILLLFLLLGFFTLYFSTCFLHTLTHSFALRPSRLAVVRPPAAASPSPRGLNAATVLSFPVLTFSSARGRCSLDCAICLSEFADEDLLRLLTLCRHAFHRDCVDLWFTSHKTCPVCRRPLDVLLRSPEKAPPPSPPPSGPEREAAVVVTIDADNVLEEMTPPSSTAGGMHCRRRSGGGRPERFSRSNSTGHSMEVYGWVKVSGGGERSGGSDPLEVSVMSGGDEHRGGDIRSIAGGDIDVV